MNVSLWISSRLRTVGGGSKAAVIIAVAGVALSLAVMEASLAISVGFKDAIRAKLTGFDAAVTVEAPIRNSDIAATLFLTRTPALDSIVRANIPSSAELRLSLRQPGMLKTDDNFQGVVYVGQQPEATFDFERSCITDGEWPDFAADSCANDIVVSESLARSLGLAKGDKVFSTFIIDGDVKLRRHRIAALYNSSFGEYDMTVVFASLGSLQRVAGVDSLTGTRLDIRGIPDADIESRADALQRGLIGAVATRILDEYYPVDNIRHSGALYFNWLSLLDTNVAVILALMFAVAAFTLVSSMYILILERVRMIGVLRTIGASGRLVEQVFTGLGMRLLLVGMLIGNIFGTGILLVQKYTHAIPLDPDMYYLSYVPVDIRPWAFIALNTGVIVAAWLTLAIPARTASRTDPSQVIARD